MPDENLPAPPRQGDVYNIPVEGSLGLLALGAVGIKAWRDVRDRHQAEHVAAPSTETGVGATAATVAGPVVVVSGLPRSGTSMMMQMLRAGGLPLLTDGVREADANNPRGYLEYEKVKSLARDNSWVKEAAGQAIKIIAPLVPYLPNRLSYRVVFMERDLDEVLTSQQSMLERLNRAAADPPLMRTIYTRQIEEAKHWLERHPRTDACYVAYAETVRDPAAQAARVAAFLSDCSAAPLNVAAMAATLDPSLYRERPA